MLGLLLVILVEGFLLGPKVPWGSFSRLIAAGGLLFVSSSSSLELLGSLDSEGNSLFSSSLSSVLSLKKG